MTGRELKLTILIIYAVISSYVAYSCLKEKQQAPWQQKLELRKSLRRTVFGLSAVVFANPGIPRPSNVKPVVLKLLSPRKWLVFYARARVISSLNML